MKILKYWPSYRDFNKLVIKAKMRANTYFEFLFFVYIYIYIYIYIYMKIKYDIFLRDLVVCMKTNYFIYLFIYVLPKTGYFNTKLLSLQYKNTNRCWLKYRKKNHRFLKHLFLFFYLGWAHPDPCGGAGPSHLRSWDGPDQPSLVTSPCQWPAHLFPCTRNS